MPYRQQKIKKIQSLLLVLLSFQVALLLERLIFDCLGKIYMLILATSLTFVLNIGVVFGVAKLNVIFIKFFVFWSVLWVALNIFVVFIYLKVGPLTHEQKWLSFRKNSRSWFDIHGFGCNSTEKANSEVNSCVIKFEYIEAGQSIVHILLAVTNLCASIWLLKKLEEKPPEERFNFINGTNSKSNKPRFPLQRKNQLLADEWL